MYMTELVKNFCHFITGKGTVDKKYKYMFICLGLGLIHVIFTCGFAAGNIVPMFIYNVIVSLFYLYISLVSIPKERYIFSVITVYVEILLCAIYSCVMLGWDWGFGMYTLSMVPATYYLAYTLPAIKRKIAVPTMLSGIIGACYILTRAFCGRVEPFYTEEITLYNMQICFYYFNIIIAFVVLLLFSTMFATEILYMQKRLEKENIFLGEAASIDPLTRLLNRRSMNARLKAVLENVVESDSCFCLMLIDIDDFKHVNDTYGHDCGDEVLVAISKIITDDVREEDAVCRWGGEEILVMIKSKLSTAKNVAERICQDIRQTTITHNQTTVNVTITVGISEYAENKTLSTMIEEADKNMYYGKNHGKNQVVAQAIVSK